VIDVPVTADEYAQQQYTELDRRLAKKRQSQERRALETLANTGGLGGGAQNARMREVEQDIGEQWHQAASDIEATRLAATEAARQREWGTSEREGTQAWQGSQNELQRLWQTGERTGAEAATAALSAQEAGQALTAQTQAEQMQQRLQQQAEEAAAALQAQIQKGQMTQQEAEQAWLEVQNQLNREQELFMQNLQAQNTSALSAQEAAQALAAQTQAEAAASGLSAQQAEQMSGLSAQEAAQALAAQTQSEAAAAGLQANQIAADQWETQFGADTAMALQNDTQAFEQGMAVQEHDWELANQAWQEQMWGLDAQLQLSLGGWDWNEDGLAGGAPAWITGDYGSGGGIPGGGAAEVDTGSAADSAGEYNVAEGSAADAGSTPADLMATALDDALRSGGQIPNPGNQAMFRNWVAMNRPDGVGYNEWYRYVMQQYQSGGGQ
jgi:hypothetical protein